MAIDRPEQVMRTESAAIGYGGSLVVRGVSVSAGHGEIVTIVGPNGSGKSTLLKALAGLVPVQAGRIWHAGADVTALPAEARARRGIAYLPQEREVFASLTVRENLLMGGYQLHRRDLSAALERVHATYPILGRLSRTQAGRLSGGERKVVAMARVMMSSPSVALLDEPTANLAPRPSAQFLGQDVPALAASGVAVILVEQRVAQALAVSDWMYVLFGGAVTLQARARAVAQSDIAEVFLGRGLKGAADPEAAGQPEGAEKPDGAGIPQRATAAREETTHD